MLSCCVGNLDSLLDNGEQAKWYNASHFRYGSPRTTRVTKSEHNSGRFSGQFELPWARCELFPSTAVLCKVQRCVVCFKHAIAEKGERTCFCWLQAKCQSGQCLIPGSLPAPSEVNNEPYDYTEVDLDYATCNVPARYLVSSIGSTPVP